MGRTRGGKSPIGSNCVKWRSLYVCHICKNVEMIANCDYGSNVIKNQIITWLSSRCISLQGLQLAWTISIFRESYRNPFGLNIVTTSPRAHSSVHCHLGETKQNTPCYMLQVSWTSRGPKHCNINICILFGFFKTKQCCTAYGIIIGGCSERTCLWLVTHKKDMSLCVGVFWVRTLVQEKQQSHVIACNHDDQTVRHNICFHFYSVSKRDHSWNSVDTCWWL